MAEHKMEIMRVLTPKSKLVLANKKQNKDKTIMQYLEKSLQRRELLLIALIILNLVFAHARAVWEGLRAGPARPVI